MLTAQYCFMQPCRHFEKVVEKIGKRISPHMDSRSASVYRGESSRDCCEKTTQCLLKAAVEYDRHVASPHTDPREVFPWHLCSGVHTFSSHGETQRAGSAVHGCSHKPEPHFVFCFVTCARCLAAPTDK